MSFGATGSAVRTLSTWRTRGVPFPLRIVISCTVIVATIFIATQESFQELAPVPFLVVFVSSLLSSIGGFAFSAMCGSLLFHLMTPLSAVRLMVVCSIAIQAFSVMILRNSIDLRLLCRFVVGGLITLPIGIYLLVMLDPKIYREIFGAFLIVYGVFMLVRPNTTVRFQRPWADCIAGSVGGITGGFAGFPGAFVTIWCALKGWDKDRQRGVYQPFILIMQLCALVAFGFLSTGRHGHAAHGTLDALLYIPAALLGTWCGLGFYSRLSRSEFAVVVNTLLIFAGGALAL